MAKLGLENKITSDSTRKKTIKRFKELKIKLPTFSELRSPETIDKNLVSNLSKVDRNSAHPLNLYRINWFNRANEDHFSKTPHYLLLTEELTGVKAKIAIMIGANFPMVDCHKVLAAYGCLAPRIITGQFDPTIHKAIWPSTGNYCRGGVAVSRIMDCNGVAILPEEMSKERFDWLNKWTKNPATDIYKTYGCESNVKEIYDKCNELGKDPSNIIFNQFCEYGNALIHYYVTGHAAEIVVNDIKKGNSEINPRAFVSATGSAGTLSAGDYLKEIYKDFKIAAVEALECPTLLTNGFGGHNIQGIGDKHVPYVHNAMNTDYVIAVSDRATDGLNTLFNSDSGKRFMSEELKLSRTLIESLDFLGISSICNILAAIKLAKHSRLGENDLILTVATDSAKMYRTEMNKTIERDYRGKFTELQAALTYGRYMLGTSTDNMEELNQIGRERIFNLGYYTWVEQQGVSIEDFVARKEQKFWNALRKYIPVWDKMITEFNSEVGA